ncbi:hypothetical protein EJB05_05786, partial [Eragrostis curvula]
MAVDLVMGAVGSLISKLGKLLEEEYKLQKGVSGKIGTLIKELECAYAALHKVGGVPPDELDEQVKIWACEVREASYDMEDVLDTFLVSAEGGHEHSDHESLFERLKKLAADAYNMVVSGTIKRRKITLMIDDIKNKLEEAKLRCDRYAVDSIVSKPATASNVDPRLKAMYTEVTQLVGIGKPSSDLISKLSLSQGGEASNKKVKIVSVVGIGGLGKTTLAKAVYDKLKPKFGCGAFVPVGQNPDLKKVFKDVLIDLEYMDPKMSILDEKQLIDELRKYLKDKRYFIVIDDVWKTETWKTIKCAFAENNNESRLIITTRISGVAIQADEVYNLKQLPFDKSKTLFYKRIFGGEGTHPDNQLDRVSDEILKKCDGVPLAIITMASLLLGKSWGQWIELCNSIGFHNTNQILSLSYYDLPAHLKTCLLYLSAFPEDQVIDKNCLIWKWVAEGFVHKKQGNGFFEVGDGYFNELINRSMIQAVQSEQDGIVYGCRVHDMVLDLLRFISREEKFIVTISNNSEATLSPRDKVRRLSHQRRTVDLTRLDHHMDLGHLRSLIACSCDYKGVSLRSFEFLHVLALENCKVLEGCIPLEHLESLVHLRYLGLRGMDISQLPEKIGALKFLQTLDLEGTCVKELPSSVGLLTQLICLRARETKIPDGVIEKLTSLEELHISGILRFVKDLGKLSELRVLKANFLISYKRMQTDFGHSIRNLPKIHHLDLRGIGAEMWEKGVLSRQLQHLIVPDSRLTLLPICINPCDLPNLTHLDLYLRSIKDYDLKILGVLPELRHLKLKSDPSDRNVAKLTLASTASHCSFQKLRYCKLHNSTVQFVLNEDWSVSFTVWQGSANVAFGSKRRDECRDTPAVMPNLEELVFLVRVQHVIDMNCGCDNLGLEYLPSLQKVKVHFMTADTNHGSRKKVKDDLTNAVELHPKRPTIELCYSSSRFGY